MWQLHWCASRRCKTRRQTNTSLNLNATHGQPLSDVWHFQGIQALSKLPTVAQDLVPVSLMRIQGKLLSVWNRLILREFRIMQPRSPLQKALENIAHLALMQETDRTEVRVKIETIKNMGRS